jgi:hypothetical protein
MTWHGDTTLLGCTTKTGHSMTHGVSMCCIKDQEHLC